jgi:chromosomal replication initiation ATPase DnaA
MKIIVEFKFPKDIDEHVSNEFIFGDVLKSIPFRDVSYKIINRVGSKTITLDSIEKSVCDYICATPEELQHKTRKREILIGRQLCHYLSKRYTKTSLTLIGKRFGNKDHSTVLHSNRIISDLIETDKEFQREYLPFLESFK